MRSPHPLIPAAIFAALLLLISFTADASSSSSSRTEDSEWRSLTKHNFSAEIRRHPHLLLFVTLPWSGESRSLMKEVSRLVTDRQDEHGNLKLRVIYRNSEKMLADILGATEGISIFYYHYSTSYKYQGHLRARKIVFSIYQFASLQLEETFIKTLSTRDDINKFFQSTDKAVLLLEFCGWSAKLLQETKTLDDQSDNAIILGEKIARDVGGGLSFDKKNPKVLEDEELTCRAENGLGVDSWHREFTWENRSASQTAESIHANSEVSCTLESFHQFQSFFSNFKIIAREHCLLPERQRFGLISDRSLVPLLGVDSPTTWLLMLHFPGCVNCSIVFQEGDDLRTFIQAHNSFVMELGADGQNLEPIFPADRPSLVLFIDRSSDISKVREESKSALEFLRRFAHHTQLSYQMVNRAYRMDYKSSSAEASFGTWSRRVADHSGHRSKKHLAVPGLVKSKDKMSVMIVNQGESISLENIATVAQSNSMQDILAYLLNRDNLAFSTKEKKISLLAKEVGFQLLSDDFDVQVVDSSTTDKVTDKFREMDIGANLSPQELNEQGISVNNAYLDNNADATEGNEGKQDELSDTKAVRQQNPETVAYRDSETSKSATKLVREVNVERGVAKSHENDNSCMHENVGSVTCQAEGNEENQDGLSDTKAVRQQNPETVAYRHSDTSKSATKLAQEVNVKRGVAKSHENDDSCMQENVRSDTCQADNAVPLDDESLLSEYIEQEDSQTDNILNKRHSRENFQERPLALSDMVSVGDGASEFKVPTRNLSEPHIQHKPFLGPVFFSDGNYQLLRTLTGGSKIPHLVILDPVLQQHYVFPEETDISYSTLFSFVYEFLNGSLTPYRKSGSPSVCLREAPPPPFVNLDFHETDSIPRLTINTFCEMVVGNKQCELANELSNSDIQNFETAWKTDVLVAFSTPWCGFCQRMELIVREVYRAFKNFAIILKSKSMTVDPMNIEGKMADSAINKLPSVFLMDCTENDCAPFLKSIGKKEHYPALLLFPAENKTVISYEGDASVVHIFEFLLSHGSNSQFLNMHKGSLWTHTSEQRKIRRTSNVSSFSVDVKPLYAKDVVTEVLMGAAVVEGDHYPVASHTFNKLQEDPSSEDMYAQIHLGTTVGEADHLPAGSQSSHYKDARHVIPGTILAATDKLRNAFPFDNSTVVIVKADQSQGFLGVIINKPETWDVFKPSEELEILRQAPLFFGGPVRASDAPLVSLTRKPENGFTEVESGLYFGDPSVTNMAIEQIVSGNHSAKDYSFFLGYSSWEWNQLFAELEEGAWLLTTDELDI